jgi:integrase
MKHTRGRGRVYRQPGSSNYWIQYSVRGVTHRESSGSIRVSDANQLLTKRLADANAGKPVGTVVERTTLGDLTEMIKNEYEINKRASRKRLGHALDHITEFFTAAQKARDFTTDRSVAYTKHRQEQGAANATINRELAALKRMFSLAVRADKVVRKPYIAMLEENNARQGFIEHAEFVALRNALPLHLRDPITFLYLSGWRVSEMKSLEWCDVDSDRTVVRLSPAKSKNKEGRVLPLTGELAGVFARAQATRRIDCPLVFHAVGSDFRGAWTAACTKVGLGKLLVHDLRRSAIRNLVRAGVPDAMAMSLSGHKTRSIFNRYNIVSEADLVSAVTRRDSYLEARPTERKVIPLKTGTE